jgi:hypothetical protein
MNSTFTIYNESDPQSMKQFADEFEETEAGKKFFSMYSADDVEDAWDVAVSKYQNVNGNEPITLGDFVDFVNALILSGGLQKPEPPAPKEKKLSASQLAWQEYREFSETHSMVECKARAQQDSSFASFMRLNLEREAANRNPQMVNLNANRSATTQFVSAELQRFVEDYKVMAMDKVRKLSNAGTNPGGKPGADHFNSLLNTAIGLGLV